MNFDQSLRKPKKFPHHSDTPSPMNFHPTAYRTVKPMTESIYKTQPQFHNTNAMNTLSKQSDQQKGTHFENSKSKNYGLQFRHHTNYESGDYNSNEHREGQYATLNGGSFSLYRNQGINSNSVRNEQHVQGFNTFNLHKNDKSKPLINHNTHLNESRGNNSEEKNKMLNKLEFFKEKPQSTNIDTSRTEQQYNNPVTDRNDKPAIDLKKFCIDDFEIGIKLGKGKFGDVFLAREKKTDFIIALKVLNKAEIQRLNAEKLVVREIKIHSYLDHKNIIKLYGFFHDDDNIYLILEYAPDGELYKELKSTPNNRFTEEKTSKIIRQVLDAFIYLQSLDIIHRDLKPENLLSFMGQVKLADFGWSVCSQDKKRKTFCGTIDYMPPEMANGAHYDFKSDNWAIGVLAYEFMVGKAPFETKSRGLTLDGIKRGDIEYPSFLSEDAKDFINKLLITDPQTRMGLTQAIQHPFIKKYYKE